MLLTPRPGVNLDNLLQTLDSCRSAASNLWSGGGPGTAHGRLLSYLEWAGTAARMLGYQISEADLAALVLNRRYELLLSSFSGMASTDTPVQRVVNDLVRLELEGRVKDFDTAIATLKAYKERWSSVGDLLVLDTNFYVEHPDEVQDADLAQLTAATTPGWKIHVLVPLLVVDELDRLKRDNRVRSRARTALKSLNTVFSQVSEGQPMGRLREDAPNLGPVTMELLFDPPDHERLPDPDAEIVDRALAVQNMVGHPVTMVTYDTSMAFRARQAGLKDLLLLRRIQGTWGPHPLEPNSRGYSNARRNPAAAVRNR